MQISDIILRTDTYSDDQIDALMDEVAQRPYFHAAALTLASALYINHDQRYGDTLQRTAIGIPDRNSLFMLIEAEEYGIEASSANKKRARQRVTAADATTDYIAYMMQSDIPGDSSQDPVAMRGQSLIDKFIESNAQGERIQLGSEKPNEESKETVPAKKELTVTASDVHQEEASSVNDEDISPEYFTETMARIYIKQGKFDKASKIISRLNAKYQKKNRYFADQMRFLEKLKLNQRCQNIEN